MGADRKLLYLSLGSLGCMDVPLMQRVIDSLDKTPHRVIVSMGPLHEQLKLGDRMWGKQFVPQTAIVPQCDVMITHGGNNTVGEAFTFGVPTIVLPLFWISTTMRNASTNAVTEHGFPRTSSPTMNCTRRSID